MKILITVDKFNNDSKLELEKYCHDKHQIVYNKLNRKLNKQELIDLLKTETPDIIIAGTEKYNDEILNICPNLKLISRVGIGLDSIDIEECLKRNIIIKNTPDAPTNAVVELTIGQIFNALRKIQETDSQIRKGEWKRYVGKDLSECNVGIIGHGRIGSLLSKKLQPLVKNIYINDVDPNQTKNALGIVTNLKELLNNSDIVTLHIPMTDENKDLISKKELDSLKNDIILINTARGGIINEEDLYDWLIKNPQSTAVMDVFNEEPYVGKLIKLNNCYLTSHLGSCTVKSRQDMEIGSIKNILEWL